MALGYLEYNFSSAQRKGQISIPKQGEAQIAKETAEKVLDKDVLRRFSEEVGFKE